MPVGEQTLRATTVPPTTTQATPAAAGALDVFQVEEAEVLGPLLLPPWRLRQPLQALELLVALVHKLRLCLQTRALMVAILPVAAEEMAVRNFSRQSWRQLKL